MCSYSTEMASELGLANLLTRLFVGMLLVDRLTGKDHQVQCVAIQDENQLFILQ